MHETYICMDSSVRPPTVDILMSMKTSVEISKDRLWQSEGGGKLKVARELIKARILNPILHRGFYINFRTN